jgi:hypothetical protein
MTIIIIIIIIIIILQLAHFSKGSKHMISTTTSFVICGAHMISYSFSNKKSYAH